MAVDFTGTWKYNRSENFDDYLKEMDVNFVKRKLANTMKPVQKITQEADGMTITTSGGPKEDTINFKYGTEFEREMNLYDGKVKIVVTREGDKVVVSVTPQGKGKAQKVTRYIENGELVMQIEVGSVICKRYFSKA